MRKNTFYILISKIEFRKKIFSFFIKKILNSQSLALHLQRFFLKNTSPQKSKKID
ncbi:hypothetical protein FEM08_15920 [Flavobacterium gilvum]|nr:hypothetical protein FEM08_15920 [Flavobacterium gilvum]